MAAEEDCETVMTKKEFLQELRIALQGQVPQAQVNEHLQYYDNYIMEESRKGRTEEQVIESLGSPRLIAKTIHQTSDSTRQKGRKKEAKPGTGGRRLRTWILGILCLLVLVRIGVWLLPVLLFALFAGAAAYVIFLIFSGNKN